MQRWVDLVKKFRYLQITGEPGLGKSHFAGVIAKELMKESGGRSEFFRFYNGCEIADFALLWERLSAEAKQKSEQFFVMIIDSLNVNSYRELIEGRMERLPNLFVIGTSDYEDYQLKVVGGMEFFECFVTVELTRKMTAVLFELVEGFKPWDDDCYWDEESDLYWLRVAYSLFEDDPGDFYLGYNIGAVHYLKLAEFDGDIKRWERKYLYPLEEAMDGGINGWIQIKEDKDMNELLEMLKIKKRLILSGCVGCGKNELVDDLVKDLLGSIVDPSPFIFKLGKYHKEEVLLNFLELVKEDSDYKYLVRIEDFLEIENYRVFNYLLNEEPLDNLYIIGTTDSFTWQTKGFPLWLKKHFLIREMTPEFSQWMLMPFIDEFWYKDSKERMERLNIYLVEQLGSACQVGAGLFIRLKELDGDFDRLWDRFIEPVVRYYVDERVRKKVDDRQEGYEILKGAEEAYWGECRRQRLNKYGILTDM